MPQIVVLADSTREQEEAEMLRERVSLDDLQSDHFARQLVERLEWAVQDAHAAERAPNGARGARP